MEVQQEGRVYAKLIRIDNVLGLAHLEIKPGKVTVISGPNESGKTSALEAIATVVGGGHDATLLRKGAEKGEVVIVLSNGVELRKTIGPEKSKLTGRHPDLGQISSAQTYLQGLAPMESFNPVKFMDADDKTRISMLLRAVPAQIPYEDIMAAASSLPDVDVGKTRSASHPIEMISQLARHIYDIRTGDNRSVKDKEATAAALSTALPPPAIMDAPWAGKIESLNRDIEAAAREEASMKAKRDADLAAIKSTLDADVKAANDRARAEAKRITDEAAAFTAGTSATIASFKADVLRDLEADKQKLEAAARKLIDEMAADTARRNKLKDDEALAQTEDVNLIARDSVAEITRAAQANETAKRESWDLAIAEEQAGLGRMRAELAEATSYKEQVDRAKQANDTRRKMLEEAAAFAGHAAAASKALDALELLKRKALSSFPVAGLSVDPTTAVITLNGVPFDRLSEAQRVEVSFAVAKAGLGRLPIMCVDGLERLDDKRFELFRQRAVKEDIQLFVTRVDDGEFRVDTE